ncbi:EscU/YscU/HrcU family type III secretion system export apparatus switch protein [Silvimonas soli]|uniref:EscU/YscU/HrcU family type III secretion system export apparatus switch protein n=1 Tax=Silvimonas soli TaxID=2980100 RepID=UPI0024B35EA5|nr:EscU/YscU/HrcU family type III secretion system export apparatus switch protein [Silvimonas soli]
MASKPDARQRAVALAYTEGSTPRVVASGKGLVAQAIIEKAREAGVFVHQSPELVSLLMQLDLDAHIPAPLYRAVAELLAFVYLVEQGSDIAPPQLSLPPAPADASDEQQPDALV